MVAVLSGWGRMWNDGPLSEQLQFVIFLRSGSSSIVHFLYTQYLPYFLPSFLPIVLLSFLFFLSSLLSSFLFLPYFLSSFLRFFFSSFLSFFLLQYIYLTRNITTVSLTYIIPLNSFSIAFNHNISRLTHSPSKYTSSLTHS